MSVETQHQSRVGGGAFSLAPPDDDVMEAAPLNLTHFQRRNGRKRSTPQKSVMSEEAGENDESGSDDPFPDEYSTDDDNNNTINKASSDISEETKNKARSILEHYKSYIQRHSTELQNDLSQLASKKMKLMKTVSLGSDGNVDSAWKSFANYQSGGSDEPMTFEPVVSGPVNGPNGLIPERTMRQNNWAIKVWRDWALSRNRKPETKLERFSEAPVDIRVADIEVMSYWLPRFIKEVRRKDKKPYPADTLMQIASGLQRYLRQVSCRSEVNFFDKYSNTFAEFRDALKTRSGELSMEAQANKCKKIQVDNLSDDELWQSGYLDHTTAKGMFHVVFYYNCVEFEISSMEEHHELKVEQFHIGVDPSKNNQEYIEFNRSDQRYYNMSTKQVMRRYANPQDPRCLVKLYKSYLDLVPSTGPFYRRPLQTPENSSPRFSFNPVGINKLRETYKQLFSPDRPASLRRTGKTITIRYMSQHSSDQDHVSTTPPPQPKVSQSPHSTPQAVYDALTQKLRNGQLNSNGVDAVDLSLKTSESYESEEEPSTPMTTESVIDRIRRSWHNARQRSESEEAKKELPESDDVLTLKVPRCVKYVVIEREGKKQKFALC